MMGTLIDLRAYFEDLQERNLHPEETDLDLWLYDDIDGEEED